MKRAVIFLVAALAVPGAAIAKQPPNHPNHGKGTPYVLYVLKGTLSSYTAYDSATSTNGSITIDVNRANRHGRALKGMSLTFSVTAKTKIVLRNGKTSISNGDRGIVTIKAPKKIAAAELAAKLQAQNARQVIDPGRAAPQVMYVLEGTLSSYTAYDSATSTNGSITIDVKRANRYRQALKDETLTFSVSAKTKIVLQNGQASISDGDHGVVTVKAPKRIAAADLASALQALSARQVIDKGIPSSS